MTTFIYFMQLCFIHIYLFIYLWIQSTCIFESHIYFPALFISLSYIQMKGRGYLRFRPKQQHWSQVPMIQGPVMWHRGPRVRRFTFQPTRTPADFTN